MKVKNIYPILLIALILASCTPTLTADSPTETAAPTSTFTPAPLAAAATPTPKPEIIPPTIEPTSRPTNPLSEAGPWLLYLHNTPRSGCCGGATIPAEFILINQDGSGRTSITIPECYNNVSAFIMDGGSSVNYLAEHDELLYLFRPSQAAGMRVHPCSTGFNGDGEGGLLASFYHESEAVSPELILFELPGGEILERFPLVRCSQDTEVCEKFRSNWSQIMIQQPQWDPDGRYLAFVAIMDAASSDLFIYDAENGDLRRLTADPNWVGGIDWSPDGSKIIYQYTTDEEILSLGEYFHSPYWEPPVSVWSISFNTNEKKYLYKTVFGHLAGENILFWLDEDRYIAYEGILGDALDGAINLRFVDIQAGTNRVLFDGWFFNISYDPIHKTFALYQAGSGTYLLSMDNGNIIYLDGYTGLPLFTFPEWDKNTGLFVSETPCEDDPEQVFAVDYQGNIQCLPNPTPTPTAAETAEYPAPNGQWRVSVNNGLWLEANDEPAVLVSPEAAAEVIWCPDSSCFFFTVSQQNQLSSLYHVSLPDLTIKMVDDGIESNGSYQWLGVEN